MVMLLSASYMATLAGFIRLRRHAAQLPRPFRAPGGVFTAGIALSLSALLFSACVYASAEALVPMAVILAAAAGWYVLGAKPRHQTPT